MSTIIFLIFLFFNCFNIIISFDIVKVSGQNILLNGSPFIANGAAGQVRLDLLKQVGGKVVRTYGDETGRVLDMAQKVGLKVLAGFWMGQPIQGFDYNNKNRVKAQLDSIRSFVNKYKNHPALLIWGIGNEVETGTNNLIQIWKAIDEAAKLVRSLDPNHPTMAVLAEIGDNKAKGIVEHAPNIQILGINSYGPGLSSVVNRARSQGWKGPIIITELGPLGAWEAKKTSWGAPIEPTSDEKAILLNKYMSQLKGKVQGEIVFLFGSKFETTPTWYNFLHSNFNNAYERGVEVMASQFGGNIKNRAPRINTFRFTNNQNRWNKGTNVQASISLTDPDGDKITVVWSVLAENTNAIGANFTTSAIRGGSSNGVTIQGTLNRGPYRLFMAALDNRGAIASANLPFYVN